MSENKSIEIELDFADFLNKEQILKLKTGLVDSIPGLEIRLKEYPIVQGKMSGGEIDLQDIVMYASIVSVVEVPLIVILENFVEKFKHVSGKIWPFNDPETKNKETNEIKNSQSQGIIGSIKSNNENKNFRINTEGVLEELYYEPYLINPEKTFAVLVGCSEYLFGIPPINPVADNIRDMKKLLLDKNRFGLSRDNIEIALNESCHEIQEKLYNCSRKSGIETFIFYYAGHGFTTLSTEYALAAHNTEKKGDFINSGIEKKFIEHQILEGSPANQKVVIIDACYSGILTQGVMPEVFNNVTGTYILTSSSYDEVSLFDKDNKHTYFTSALIEILQSGIANEKETITLDDLYNYTKDLLLKKRLPHPTFKSGLTIPPSAFSIASNPSFSYENLKNKVELLFSQGKFPEASFIIKKLRSKFPNIIELKELALKINDEKDYSDLLLEADRLNIKEQDYPAAIELYKKLLLLKDDPNVKERLNNCISRLNVGGKNNNSIVGSNSPISDKHETLIASGQEQMGNTIKHKPWPIKKIIIGLIATFVAVFIGDLIKENVSKHRKGQTEKFSTSKKDSINPKNTNHPFQDTTVNKKEKSKATKNTDLHYGSSNIIQNPVPGSNISSNLQLLNSQTFSQPESTDNLTFIYMGNNLLEFTGKAAGYNIHGKLREISKNNLQVIDGNVTGILTLTDNYNKIIGSITITESKLPHKLILGN